ncbi:LacI family DNA-binding transcriptional regulator [Tuanshanicoccus lijuaniae]|uniref:LacI family DNA-binding transcriptional regulator n=1 Tax=Aerococcaceae bacterium zg-1292 TaxID=2774330 RepID=UPI001936F085|nr:LacI family DNA-binding transcriptional regulator [Aerococcaceae bacterium zg-1292]QQA36530.1 LacI family DNA-binding transcriptional regulator [Aerococcaceae bacterium zg-1292]
MKITIKEIAQLANVSVTTVSNVINNRSKKVSQQTIDRINEIIKEYNYTPNMNAKALVNSSSKLIGLLFYTEGDVYNFNDPFAGALLEGIENVTNNENYFVLLQTINSVDDIAVIRNNWQFSGFIGVGFQQQMMEETMNIVKEPITFIDTYYDEEGLSDLKQRNNLFFVRTDDRKLAHELVDYLVDKGHQNIAFLTYRVNFDTYGVIQERLAGYKEGLVSNGLAFNPELVYTNDQLDKMLNQLDKFSAVVVTADLLAIQVMSKLKEKGYQIPTDCSIISFDNIQFSELSSPKLTTMNLFQNKKGELAIGQILAPMKGILDKSNQQTIIMDGELEIRESVKTL